MALIIFKYCLPILLGLTLFTAITGRYLPLPRPRSLAKRPNWFLGLWTGISISVIMLVGLNLAYRMDLNDLPTLVVPGLWITAAALIPGIIGFLWYRSDIKRQIAAEQDTRLVDAIEHADSEEFDNTLAIAIEDSDDADSTQQISDTVILESSLFEADRQYSSWAANMDSVEMDTDDLDETQLFSVNNVETSEPNLVKELELQSTNADSDVDATADNKIETESEALNDAELAATMKDISDTLNADSDEGSAEDTQVIEVPEELKLSASELAIEEQRQSHASELKRLRDELSHEVKSRKELETHLRITRKGLSELESESRGFESDKAAALMEIEKELEEKIKRTAAAEARAEREAEKRAALEEQMVHVREDALKATNECRVSTEARAKALSTASKASTIARQAMQIRTRLETQLNEANAELDHKQQTISSLIKALEKEKSRTQEDVASMAKQLVLHEKQLQARRTLEEVSRSVDNKLSTRLVKKVAKARG